MAIIITFPVDCTQVRLAGNRQSGVYTIYPGGENTPGVRVYCDQDTDGGGWTVSALGKVLFSGLIYKILSLHFVCSPCRYSREELMESLTLTSAGGHMGKDLEIPAMNSGSVTETMLILQCECKCMEGLNSCNNIKNIIKYSCFPFII